MKILVFADYIYIVGRTQAFLREETVKIGLVIHVETNLGGRLIGVHNSEEYFLPLSVDTCRYFSKNKAKNDNKQMLF